MIYMLKADDFSLLLKKSKIVSSIFAKCLSKKSSYQSLLMRPKIERMKV